MIRQALRGALFGVLLGVFIGLQVAAGNGSHVDVDAFACLAGLVGAGCGALVGALIAFLRLKA